MSVKSCLGGEGREGTVGSEGEGPRERDRV